MDQDVDPVCIPAEPKSNRATIAGVCQGVALTLPESDNSREQHNCSTYTIKDFEFLTVHTKVIM